jgi:uncharacterized membrane protein YkvA (DUF1232 family)
MTRREYWGFPGAERFMTRSIPENLNLVTRRFWRVARRGAARLPFLPDLVAAYFCALDQKTPLRVRGTLLAALAYFVLPADVVPDFLPALGFTDDAAVLLTALGLVSSHVTDEHREKAREALADEAA